LAVDLQLLTAELKRGRVSRRRFAREMAMRTTIRGEEAWRAILRKAQQRGQLLRAGA
jgi:hypothetical protein